MKLHSIVLMFLVIPFFIESSIAFGDGDAYVTRLGKIPLSSHRRQLEDTPSRFTKERRSTNEEEESNGVIEDAKQIRQDRSAEDDYSSQVNVEPGIFAESLEKVNVAVRAKKEALERYVRDTTGGAGALHKLMSETSQLAHEVGDTFKLFAKREVSLANDVEELKKALNEAIVALKQSLEDEHKELLNSKIDIIDNEGQVSSDRQKRNAEYHKNNQFKACVSLEPEAMSAAGVPGQVVHKKPGHPVNPPNIKEYMPPYKLPGAPGSQQVPQAVGIPPPPQSPPLPQLPPPNVQPMPAPIPAMNDRGSRQFGSSAEQMASIENSRPRPLPMIPQFEGPPAQSQPPGPYRGNLPQLPPNQQGPVGVDLHEIYWLRLDPTRKQEKLHKKVDELFMEKQNSGKDILLIPVSHNFKNEDQVKSGFLRAVSLRPEKVLKSKRDTAGLRRLRSITVIELDDM